MADAQDVKMEDQPSGTGAGQQPEQTETKKKKKTYAEAQAERKEQFKKRYADKCTNSNGSVWEQLQQEGDTPSTHYACHLTKTYFVTARQCAMHMEETEYTEALKDTSLTAPTEEFLADVKAKAETESKARLENFNKSKKRSAPGGADADAEKLKQHITQLTKQVESRDRRNVELTALLDKKREENFTLKQEKHALILENQQLRKSLNGLLKQLKQEK
eukprot:TRINITY_DN9459_c0_g1_i1.p2 TRINITY_DN9459_c0_g1~~TRINITY_DN9459_c0_g1_i1.p2  ORF type:complete len:225 (+),score=40.81 TRINITY_DN9459_c0_g1_i1:22-675(+)